MELAIHSVTCTSQCDEALALMSQINRQIASNGDNLSQERTQAALDTLANPELQARYGFKIIRAGFNMEHDE